MKIASYRIRVDRNNWYWKLPNGNVYNARRKDARRYWFWRDNEFSSMLVLGGIDECEEALAKREGLS